MDRKPLLAFMALFVLPFAQVCFADADTSITAARDKITFLIDAGDYNSAELAVNKMAADFAGNEILPRRLWEIANRYDKVEAYDHSKKLCEQIAANYPQDIYATYAALQLAKLKIFEQIDAGSYESAYSAVSQVMKDFTGHKQLAKRLCEIANRYDKVESLGYAKLLSARIAADYPADTYARYAALLLAKLKVCDLIDAGDYESANSAVSVMIIDFTGHKQLPKRLWEIANKYDKVEAFDYAKLLSARIAADYPKDEYANDASLLLAKLKIYESIDTGNYEAAYSAVSQVMKDFTGHKQLAKRLWEIAHRYDKFKALEYSKSLCEKIVANYPKDEYSTHSALQLAKLNVFKLIDAGDFEGAELAVSKMIGDFAGHKQLSRRLYEIAQRYAEHGARTYANQLYGRIAEGWPNDEYGVRAAFKCKIANDIFDNTKITELRNEIDNIAVNNKLSTEALPKTMLNIAEMCYEKAVNSGIDKESADKLLRLSSELLGKYVVGKATGSALTSGYYVLGLNYYTKARLTNLEGDIEGGKVFYRKAIDAWEHLINEFPESKYAAKVYFSSGVCYAQELKEYQKGIDYFQKIVEDWPKDESAAQAQLLITEYSNKMKNEK